MKTIIPSLLALTLAAAFTAQAATPKDTLVIAQSTDDADSFDPAKGFELTSVQAFTRTSISAWCSLTRRIRWT